MKKILTVMAILSIALITTFSAYAAEEKVTLKGDIYIVNKIHPELKSNSKNYTLLIPRFAFPEAKDGDTAEIEGYKISAELLNSLGHHGYRMQDIDKNAEYIVVSKITVNGKTIDVDKERNEFSGYGRGHGRNGYSKGGRMMGTDNYNRFRK